MLNLFEALDDSRNPCYNELIYHKCDDERVVNALQRCRENTVGVSVPAAASKSRSEQQTEKPVSAGEPFDGLSAVNGQAVLCFRAGNTLPERVRQASFYEAGRIQVVPRIITDYSP